MASLLLRWDRIGQRAKLSLQSVLDDHTGTLREQSDLGHPGRTTLPEGVGSER